CTNDNWLLNASLSCGHGTIPDGQEVKGAHRRCRSRDGERRIEEPIVIRAYRLRTRENAVVGGTRMVITGASGGIGAAGLRHFAGLGASVVGMDIVDGPGEQLCAELGPPHAYHHVDLADPASAGTGLAAAADHLGGLDVVWLNAGVM